MRKWMTGCAAVFVLCLFALAAQAQTADVYLAGDMKISVNEPYARDNRAYDRNLLVPLVEGTESFVYKTTADVVTYLYTVPVCEDEKTLIYLSLPCDEELTTAYLNGEPLSVNQPVEIDLTQTAELHTATKTRRALIRLTFSNLPVFSFTLDGNVTKAEQAAHLCVIDPDYNAHGWDEQKFECDAMISFRGNSSLNYSEKRPYNFSLMKDGEKWDQSLAGLRKDSDWLLDSAFNDASRMRNRVCMDVWDDICQLPWNYSLSGATEGTYAELFVNGTYKGLYALGEKQDRKELGLKKADSETQGLIIRSTNTFGENNYSPAGFHSLGTKGPGADSKLLWYNLEIKFPSAEYITDDSWTDMYDLTKLVIKGSKSEFSDEIVQYVNLNNMADYYLFNNAMNLSDNMRKNLTFVQYDRNDSRFSAFILVPWDMDASLGRAYSSGKTDVTDTSSNKLFNRLINEDVFGFKTLVYERWQELKEGALSLDHIMGYFDRYYQLLSRAGALMREEETHPKFKSYLQIGYHFNLDVEKEIGYIRTYMEQHLAYWDEQIESKMR